MVTNLLQKWQVHDKRVTQVCPEEVCKFISQWNVYHLGITQSALRHLEMHVEWETGSTGIWLKRQTCMFHKCTCYMSISFLPKRGQNNIQKFQQDRKLLAWIFDLCSPICYLYNFWDCFSATNHSSLMTSQQSIKYLHTGWI